MRFLLAAALLLTLPAQARITRLEILEEIPFAEGASFGPAGPYVRIRALARGELDPAAPANAGIALLAQAARNARGMVEYDTDVTILRPADRSRGAGVLLYDVVNRGNKFTPSWIDDAPEPQGGMVNDPRTREDAGIAFTMRRGWTVAWSGWQTDGPARVGTLIRLPEAINNGLPIVQRIRHEVVQGTRGPERVRLIGLPYPAADMQATLTVRANQADAPTLLPADDGSDQGWRWVDRSTIQLMPFGTTPTPRHIYEFTYDATRPSPTGIGFAAVRDVVAHLREQEGARHVLGFGVSLSGRFLRHFLELGMNQSEQGARVFDGALAHIAGAGKVFANEPFAMPGRTATQHEDRFYPENWPPYATATLLERAPGLKWIESNTSTEYWQKGASLIHTDAGRDAAPAENARFMLVPGTQHGGHSATVGTPGACANPRNPNSAGPALRAALSNLEAWVVQGTPPPPSVVPRVSDGTAIPASAIRMPAVPGVTWAPRDNPIGRPADWTHPPAAPEGVMPTFVPAVDTDGNETAGLRLPHLVAPLGTSTGVNVYKDLRGELCDRDGIYLPFARTRAERERTGDPRLSLEERYPTREAYVAKVTEAANALVATRYLLPEDRDSAIKAAEGARGW